MQWKNKKVIVTGGAGVIGRELIKKLQDKGAEIRCFDIAPRPLDFSSEIGYCQKDLVQLNPIEFTSYDPDVIFHLAATFERTEEDINFWGFNFDNNIILSHKVLDAAKFCRNLKSFVFASSYLIYDPALYLFDNPADQVLKLKEDSALDPRNLCGASKYFTEKEIDYISHFEEQYPFKTVSARIFRVYGRGSRDIVSRWVRAALRGEALEVFLKEGLFDYIFSGDVAEGLLRLSESPAKGIVNLGSGSSRRVGEITGIIKNEIPDVKIKESDKKGLFEASCADVSRLKQLTGWQPEINLDQGIKLLIDYENGKKN